MSLQTLIEASLPSLTKELSFRVEKVSSVDSYYTDGSAVGSFLKLAIVRRESESVVYLFPNGSFLSTSALTEEEYSILHGWLETVKSKKFECSCPECESRR
jgi:hypothetical protein